MRVILLECGDVRLGIELLVLDTDDSLVIEVQTFLMSAHGGGCAVLRLPPLLLVRGDRVALILAETQRVFGGFELGLLVGVDVIVCLIHED